MLPWPEYTRFALSLFAILTPFAAVPAYLSLTSGVATWERSQAAILAAGTAAAVLIVAALLGEAALKAIGASIASLRVGGGLVLLLMALSMSNSNSSAQTASTSRSTGAIVPLGVPLLAGPGSISSVMVEMHHGDGVIHAIAVIACVVTTCALVWAILRFAQPIGERIGPSGLEVLSRVFGLLLAAMAVNIIAAGLPSLLPAIR